MDSSSKERIVLAGCGVLAVAVIIALAAAGNPANMAICAACFIRDFAGGLMLHQAAPVQYLRPEIIGIIVGAFIMSIAGREYKARAGSSSVTRFALGFIMSIGALIFLGCPLRMVLRMAAGDLNAWVGLVGFAAGIAVGVLLLRKGFSLGKAEPSPRKTDGYILPAIMTVLFILSVTTSLFAVSAEGPGSMHAPVALSIVGGLAFGALSQRSRLCFAGGLRDVVVARDFAGFIVIGIIFVGVLAYNLITGHFNLGFAGQPIAHTEALWNILGLFIVGLAATMLGGCPLRQMVLAGTGSSDAAITFLGMLIGAAFAHNFAIAASPKGVGLAGQVMTVACIVVLFAIAAINIKRGEE
ncbi:YedE-related selenium metabolism membrane protein [Eggerthellaceae bacterium zg-1084]|uniref:YedE family putative selenium transporter n=1 Tax=Berryella wangjianweii TaxID=2734634 RepID=UPI001552BB38|nr:YedE family putative selenium transporter [Berryella wangjianweii]NPD31490.1 YedE-related selenium metabolism membrane protein [Berryella wangjianweii]NPD33010.1 YedE-related selenium metabolism membrane protein [Eggerthellaceae bacterium zg-997]